MTLRITINALRIFDKVKIYKKMGFRLLICHPAYGIIMVNFQYMLVIASADREILACR